MTEPINPKPARKPAANNNPKAPVKTPRERWLAYYVKRTKKAVRALRHVARMGNPKQYDASVDERAAVLKKLEEEMGEVRRAFTGAKKEGGLFDP